MATKKKNAAILPFVLCWQFLLLIKEGIFHQLHGGKRGEALSMHSAVRVYSVSGFAAYIAQVAVLCYSKDQGYKDSCHVHFNTL